MPFLAALVVFLLTSVVVIGAAAIALYAGAAPVGGIVFAAMWAVAAAVLARVAFPHSARRVIGWTIGGLFLGPFPAAWLSWRVSPVALGALNRST